MSESERKFVVNPEGEAEVKPLSEEEKERSSKTRKAMEGVLGLKKIGDLLQTKRGISR